MPDTPRLAIVTSHPIQYYAPWFAHLTRHLRTQVEVFYLWDSGVTARRDPGFRRDIQWDVDLVSGYGHRFVRNQSPRPGTHHFFGLINRTLVAELIAWRPDAVLLFGYRFWSHLQLLLSPHLRRVPMLFRGDSHILATPPLRRALRQPALRLLFRRFGAFLPVGHGNAAYFLCHGVPQSRLFTAPHAVDLARFCDPAHSKQARLWREELGIAPENRVILFAGKFEKKKRPDLLVDAFRAARLPRSTLLLVGDGPLASALLRQAGGHPDIRFVPFQNQSVMPRVLAAADLVVLPSQGPNETWGFIVQEAFAAERPAIVSDHVGCHPDLLQDRETGLLFPAGDVEALRNALTEALSDDARLRTWGAAARHRVGSHSYLAATAGLQSALDAVLDPT